MSDSTVPTARAEHIVTLFLSFSTYLCPAMHVTWPVFFYASVPLWNCCFLRGPELVLKLEGFFFFFFFGLRIKRKSHYLMDYCKFAFICATLDLCCSVTSGKIRVTARTPPPQQPSPVIVQDRCRWALPYAQRCFLEGGKR